MRAAVVLLAISTVVVVWLLRRSGESNSIPPAVEPPVQAGNLNADSVGKGPLSLSNPEASTRNTTAVGLPPAAKNAASTSAPSNGFAPVWRLRTAEWYCESQEMNPRRVQLSAEQLAALQAFLVQAGADLGRVRTARSDIAKQWAKDKIARGEFQLVDVEGAAATPDDSYDLHGKIAVAFAQQGGPSKLVLIAPGDCAALDAIDLEFTALATQIEEQIKALF